MAGSLNKVQIIGRAGKDPELRYTPAGKATAEFSVAVDGFRRQGEEPITEWFSIVCWEKLAETVNTLVTKGRLLYVEGRLQTRSWEGQDGQKKYRTEVVASTVTMLDSKPQQGQQSEPTAEPDEFEVPF